MRRWQLCWAALIGGAMLGSPLIWANQDAPAETKPEAKAEEKPAEAKTEDKPAEDKPAAEQKAEDKPAADKPAEAKSEAPDPPALFKKLDKDSNGELAADEVTEDQKRFFERLLRRGDKNSDGKLSADEFTAALKADERPVTDRREGGDRPGFPGGFGGPGDPRQMLERLDRNKDGKLSKADLEGAGEMERQILPRMLERLGKEEITAADLEKMRAEMMARFQGGRPPEGFGRGMPPEARDAVFARMDANGDGKITLDEAPVPARPMIERLLERLERGKDAGITKEEFSRAVAAQPGSPDGGRPGFGRPEGGRPDGAPPREGDRRPEGDRRGPDGERRPDGDRPAGAPPREGDRRGPEGERRPEGGPPRDGERRGPDGERRPEGDRPEGGRPEFGRMPGPRFFSMLDRDNDGKLSKDELYRTVELLEKLDENKDGALEPRELMGMPQFGGGFGGPGFGPGPGGPGMEGRGRFGREGMEGRGPEGRGPEGRGPGGPGGRPEGERRPEGGRPPFGPPREGGPGAERPAGRPEGERRPDGDRPENARDGRGPVRNFADILFAEFDKNKDGKISQEEAPARMKENFGRIDRNGDGFVTLEEVQPPRREESGRGRPEGGAGNRRKGDRPPVENRDNPPPPKSDA